MYSESENFQAYTLVLIVEGWVSFHSWEKEKLFTVEYLVTYHKGTLKIHSLTPTFLKVKLFTIVKFASSHLQRIDIISFTGKQPLYKR